MKIGLTGGNGFIGQAIVKQLLRGKDVELKLLDRKKHNLLKEETLMTFVKNKDVIIHLAGVNRTTNYELVQINTLGTTALLEAIVKYSPQTRIIFASTFQIYLPQSIYGVSKKSAEDLLIAYGLSKNIKSTILRLSNVYGPNGKPFYNSVIATFAHQIMQGETLNINGDGSQKRDYIHIDDVVDAFIKASTFNQKNVTEIVNICSGISTPLKTVVNTLTSASLKKVEVVYNKTQPEKPWPTKDKNFKEAKALFNWEPKTNLVNGLKAIIEQ